MAYGETKVYFDGSHYIAIPHTTRPSLKRHKVVEEKIFINQEDEGSNVKIADEPSAFLENKTEKIENKNNEKIVENCQNNSKNTQNSMFFGHLTTRKEIFEDLYKKYITLSRKCRRENIIEKMLPYFKNRENCEIYVDRNLERKLRNLICRRVRMCRKANLANFNYFCTFTYDDKKHTEETFKKKLQGCFKMMCHRKDWKYMGV
jgi:hypothetical protein